MNFTTLFGLLIGVGCVLLGQVLEGGHLGSLVQGSAAFIVFGGTLGAVILGSNREDLKTSMRLLKYALFTPNKGQSVMVYHEILDASQVARKDTILKLEKQLDKFSHPYAGVVLKYLIDGIDPKVVREIFENEINTEEERLLSGANLFMDAGGYAPTIGIIGAVLGLIHVMQNLADTTQLGAGIAVAFVATIYGVGSANLLFIPLGNKLKRYIEREMKAKEMILEGSLSIVKGLNPYIIQEQLRSYLSEEDKEKVNQPSEPQEVKK